MKKLLFIISMMASLFGENIIGLQYKGVTTRYIANDGSKQIIILERQIDPKCLYVDISNDTIWEEGYAGSKVPIECKAVFVTSVGQIQPMKVHPEIETYGELEVLKFIEKMQEDSNMMLVDTRTEPWYTYRTIPGSVNIPHHYISKPNSFPDDFIKSLKMLGVKVHHGIYDFSKAKTITLFCNGSWCSQSPSAIKSLLNLGYPAVKIKWYRGGIHDWLSLSMTTVLPRSHNK